MHDSSQMTQMITDFVQLLIYDFLSDAIHSVKISVICENKNDLLS